MSLHEKLVLLAASALKAPALRQGLHERGARVLDFPTIEIRELPDLSSLDGALARIHEFRWILFTSSHAVHIVGRRLQGLRVHLESGVPPLVCAVGSASARILSEYAVPVALVPADHSGEGVLEALSRFHGGLEGMAGSSILFPRARLARDIIPRELASAGVRVEVVVCYETVLPRIDPEMPGRLSEAPPDLLIFTSSSTVDNFVRLLGPELARRLFQHGVVAAIGPVTAATARSQGASVKIVPVRSTTVDLLEAIERSFA